MIIQLLRRRSLGEICVAAAAGEDSGSAYRVEEWLGLFGELPAVGGIVAEKDEGWYQTRRVGRSRRCPSCRNLSSHCSRTSYSTGLQRL